MPRCPLVIVVYALGTSYYNVWSEHQGCEHTTMASNVLLSNVLKELDLLVGCSANDRQWVLDTDVRWEDGFILTGMDVGADRRAWRLTPQLPRSALSHNRTWTMHTDPASGVLQWGDVQISVQSRHLGMPKSHLVFLQSML